LHDLHCLVIGREEGFERKFRQGYIARVPNIVVVEMNDNKPASLRSFKGTKTPP
jgi:hypothetical protein